jgi:hypothetical protein
VRLIRFFTRYVDVSAAWKGALFLGVLVFAINASHGAWAAMPAALKQAGYTFLVGGFIVRLCENLVRKPQLGVLALPLAVFIPALIAIGLTFLMHNLKGTPLPFYSTLPTIIIAPPAFTAWAWHIKKTDRS